MSNLTNGYNFGEINGDSDVGDMKLVIFYNVGDRIYILVTAFE